MGFYTGTNESIAAVNAGMEFSCKDYVLFVGAASHDIPFKGIEQGIIGGEAVDYSPAQIELGRERVRAAYTGDMKTFFSNGSSDRNKEFAQLSFPRIRKNLDKLIIHDAVDVFNCDFESTERFNKVYLSNVMTYDGDVNSKTMKRFVEFGNKFEDGTLFYLAKELPFRQKLESAGFVEDTDLSAKAKNLETMWSPQVLVKTGK